MCTKLCKNKLKYLSAKYIVKKAVSLLLFSTDMFSTNCYCITLWYINLFAIFYVKEWQMKHRGKMIYLYLQLSICRSNDSPLHFSLYRTGNLSDGQTFITCRTPKEAILVLLNFILAANWINHNIIEIILQFKA